MKAPKVFLSHASEDKHRFVNEFSLRLIDNGVDTWLDKWEILPGDSLVDKIFEEGLKEADAIIIVLSENSISKPWVREELNSSIVMRLQKGTRIIPVVLDKCEVPEALKTTLWEPINDILNYNENFDRILASIYGKSLKPTLGKAPPYTSTILQDIDGIEVIDNIVLKTSCEFLLKKPDYPIEPFTIFGDSNPDAPPKSEVMDSIEVLGDEKYFSVSHYVGGGPDDWGCDYQVTLFGFEEYCKAYVVDYGKTVDKCAALIANNKARTNFELHETFDIPLMIANHIIRVLENNGYVKVSDEIGKRIYIVDVSVKLKRILK
ncbi:MAG: toll/interleukin-1 receptor domain-containing protein [Gammaproteobacteria bacterium]|nr:toll/interleukin-1 receptor domain-containing protein [Gammaproteobacteria bacterium]